MQLAKKMLQVEFNRLSMGPVQVSAFRYSIWQYQNCSVKYQLIIIQLLALSKFKRNKEINLGAKLLKQTICRVQSYQFDTLMPYILVFDSVHLRTSKSFFK
jgi:hypothetical protein